MNVAQANYSQDEISEVLAALIEKGINKTKMDQMNRQKEELTKQLEAPLKIDDLKNEMKDDQRVQKVIDQYKEKDNQGIIQLVKEKVSDFKNSLHLSKHNNNLSEHHETLGNAILKLDKDVKLMQQAKKQMEDQLKQVYTSELNKVFGSQEKSDLKNEIIQNFAKNYEAQLKHQKQDDKQLLEHTNTFKSLNMMGDNEIRDTRMTALNQAADIIKKHGLSPDEKMKLDKKYDQMEIDIAKGKSSSTHLEHEKNNPESVNELNNKINSLEKKMNDVADRQKQIDKVLKSDFSKRLVDEIRKSESLMNSLDTSVKSIADSQLKNLQKEVTAFKQELTPSDLQKHQNQLSNLENKINKTKERTVDLKEEKDETKEKQITDKSKDDLAKEKQEEKVKSRSHEVTLER